MDHLENCSSRLNARTFHARITERTQHSLVCLVEIENGKNVSVVCASNNVCHVLTSSLLV